MSEPRRDDETVELNSRASPASPRPLLEPGSILKQRYYVTRELGRGGFGAVYLAEDREIHSKTVVIKVLLAGEDASAWSRKKFTSEIEALSRIDHPGIVTLLDAGETPDGLPFFVMQYVEGRPLRSIISNHGVPLATAADIIRQIGRALTAAHDKGVYHRDLKPENIILQRVGDQSEAVKVIDFGIATVSSAQSIENAESTMVAGTQSYIAPEQLLGKPTLQSDIYAFGIIAYELVTGRVPFYSVALPTLFSLQERGVQVRPKDLRHELSDEAQDLILSALAFRLEDRPARASVFGDALADALLREVPASRALAAAATPTATASATSSAPAPAVPRSRKARLLAVAAAAVVIASGTAVYLTQIASAPARSIAVLPFTNANAQADLEYISQGLTDGIVNTLGRLTGLQVRGRHAIPQFRKNAPDALSVGKMLNVRAMLAGTIVEANGTLIVNAELVDTRDGHHLWGQRYERRRGEINAIQQDICQEVAKKLSLQLTAQEKRLIRDRLTNDPEAEQLYLQGRFFWNRRKANDIDTAVTYFNRAIEKDPNYALPYAGLADALITQSGHVRPKEVMPQAELAALKALNKDETLPQAHVALASIKLHYDWDWLEAEKEYKRAIELDPSLANAHSWYAVYLWVMERFDEALVEAKRAQQLEPTSAPVRLGVARSLSMAKRYDEALEQYNEVLKMFPASTGTFVEIGLIRDRQGRYNDALASYSRVWKGSELPDNAGAVSTLGHLYAKLGRRADALGALARLEEMAQKRYVSPCEIATVQAALGQKDQAFASLDRCYEDRSWPIIFLKLDHNFDTLRDDPRYEALRRKLKL